ncbi:MAG: DUF962 domain-containing protein [Gammaproteobacteria bacterium]|jgi:uncharacterized membrane protein YGL010W|nr:DUF962 domain-containing protein [Gammaproteobacteria bacterium]
MQPLIPPLARYAARHQDSRNQLSHFFGVPLITFSLLLLGAGLRWSLAGWNLSLAQVVLLALALAYLRLDAMLATLTVITMLPLLWLAEVVAVEATSAAFWWWFGSCFVIGWAVQLLGHVFEGRRPALLDSFWQIFMAPLFVLAESLFALGLRPELQQQLKEYIRTHELV